MRDSQAIVHHVFACADAADTRKRAKVKQSHVHRIARLVICALVHVLCGRVRIMLNACSAPRPQLSARTTCRTARSRNFSDGGGPAFGPSEGCGAARGAPESPAPASPPHVSSNP